MHILKLLQSYAPATAGFFYAYSESQARLSIWKGGKSLQAEIKSVTADACNQVESSEEKNLMSDRDTIDTGDRFSNRFQKGNPGGPGRPKGVKNGEGKRATNRIGETIEREDAPEARTKRVKAGRPKGKKNKFSLSAADRMIELGFDPIEQYLELLDKVRAQGNQQLEERILSRLVPFRFAQLHHTMMTDTKDLDLQVKVAQFQAPESLGKIEGESVEKSQDHDANENDSHPDVRVVRFERKPG